VTASQTERSDARSPCTATASHSCSPAWNYPLARGQARRPRSPRI
jgi:hypothetical protein